jgi:hypothetical protein
LRPAMVVSSELVARNVHAICNAVRIFSLNYELERIDLRETLNDHT